MNTIQIIIIAILGAMVVLFAVMVIIRSSQAAKACRLAEELSQTNLELAQANSDLTADLVATNEHKELIINEIDIRDYELMRHEMSMQILIYIPRLLLASHNEYEFDAAVVNSLRMMAEFVDVDRVRVWRDYKQDGAWVGTEIYEWTGENAERLLGSERAVNSVFEEVVPHYAKALASGESINRPVCNMSPAEQEFHGSLGIKSLIEVPILLHEGFWGSIIFDDCHSTRRFSSEDEDFLRSGTLVLAYAITSKRHKKYVDLEQAMLSSYN